MIVRSLLRHLHEVLRNPVQDNKSETCQGGHRPEKNEAGESIHVKNAIDGHRHAAG